MIYKPIKHILQFFSNIGTGLIVSILFALIGLSAIISFLTNTLDYVLQTVTTATPLWLSIVLVLALYIYIRLRIKSIHPKKIPPTNEININDYEFIKDPGYFTHRVNGGEFCHPCLVANPSTASPLTEPNEGEWVCNKCNTAVRTKENTKKSRDEIKRLNNKYAR